MPDPIKVCTRCGEPAEYQMEEGVWRHKGSPRDPNYFGQTFCDRYGYPIDIKDYDGRPMIVVRNGVFEFPTVKEYLTVQREGRDA